MNELGKHGREGVRPCPRGDKDCECEPLRPGDVVEFTCVEHGSVEQATIKFFEVGHTYMGFGAKCQPGPVSLSTTQVRLVSEGPET